MTQLEREEENLEQQLEGGEITQQEYNRELQELYRDYRNAAEEAAQNAYDDEIERW